MFLKKSIEKSEIDLSQISKKSITISLNKKTVEIIRDTDGSCIVIIHDIRFKGKRKINWKEVEMFLKEYVGNCYEIAENAEKIYIGTDFPDEFTGSKDTKMLRGGIAKAKANAAVGIPELIQICERGEYTDNIKEKHKLIYEIINFFSNNSSECEFLHLFTSAYSIKNQSSN